MPLARVAGNPLITPQDVKPSHPDLQVVCVFNCGCVRMGDEVLLLLRVAERPASGPAELVAPMLDLDDPGGGLRLLRVQRGDRDLDEIDSRAFRYNGDLYLTSISHFRLAHGVDGLHFTVHDSPAMFPATPYEEYGIEDPRIVAVGSEYYISYTAVSRRGIASALASTRDFKTFERKGIIFAPDNRDVTILPDKLAGNYRCFHRPMGGRFGQESIWAAESPDLIHWGNHRFVCGPRQGKWDESKVGGGAVPIRTDRGWLSIYHGVDRHDRYCLGLLLTDIERPSRVIARSDQPILEPQTDYEKQGFFGNVVFTCGAIPYSDGRVVIYYGASDQYICAAETTIRDLLHTLDM